MKNQYLRRMLLFILFSGLFPLVIFSTLLSVILRMYQDVTFDYHKATITSQRYQVEEPLKYVEKTVIQLLSLNDLPPSIYFPRDQAYYEKFNKASTQLRQLQTYSLTLQNVVLVSTRHQWAMDYDSFQSAADSPYRALIGQFKLMDKPSFWYVDQGSGHIYLVKKLPLNVAYGDGMIIIDILSSSIGRILQKNFADFPMVIEDENGRAIVGSRESQTVVDLVRASPERWAEVQARGITRIRYDGRDYIFTWLHSEYNDWHYYSVTPVSGLISQAGTIRLIAALLVAATLVLVALYSVLSSRRLYTPIRTITRQIDDAISSDDNSAAPPSDGELSSRIDEMLIRFREVREDLKSQRYMRTQLYLKEIFSDSAEHFRFRDLTLHGVTDRSLEDCSLCVIALRYHEAFGSVEDRELWSYALQNILGEILPPDSCLPAVSQSDIFFIIHHGPDSMEQGMRIQTQNLCGMLVSLVRQYLSLEIHVGISDCFAASDSIGFAKKQSLIALRSCMQARQEVSFYPDVRQKTRANTRLGFTRRSAQIIAAAESGDLARCKEELHAYFEGFGEANFYLFKLALGDLLGELTDLCEKRLIPVDYTRFQFILDFDIMSPISTISALEEFLLSEYLHPICASVESGGGKTTAEQMTDFVARNVEGDISLEACAEALRYNPNYLSRVFREQTGKTYLEYAIEAKVERCRTLLRETDLGVGEIAEQLGYNHAQNLIRVFKKVTGTTPGQYRSRQTGKSEEQA